MPKSDKSPGRIERLSNWLRSHKIDVAIIVILLVVSFLISATNMTGYPQRFEDEGTYTSQAWAVEEKGQLAHYTYWYDHPPAGWMQIAAHFAVTSATDRYESSITAAREFMLALHLLTVVLLFALARRLGIGKYAAGIGALAYTLSPLVVEFSRYVMLDNVALVWLLAAFLLALSPKASIARAIGSAIFMSLAILSKETFVALLPVLLYAMWSVSDKRNRRFTLATFAVVLMMVCGLYILYAALKNELLPGEGHVSLFGTLSWQVFGREGSGTVFNSDSGSRGLLEYWLNIDYWLMLLGVVALPIAFFYRQLRVVAFGLLAGLALMLRTGYLPYPYIIMLLPFAALVFAGVLHYFVIETLNTKKPALRRALAGVMAAALVVVSIVWIAPAWQSKLAAITSVDQDASSREAVIWIDQNIPRDSRLVVESALWTDLQNKGFNQPEPVWLYKTETDPSVTKELGGWQGIDYIILNGPTLSGDAFDSTFPTVKQAISNAKLIAEFGSNSQKILVYKVQE